MINCDYKQLGYGSFAYVDSLSGFGTPVHLPASEGYLLERSIPGTPLVDAMGSYPLFCCEDWSALSRDLDQMSDELVSVSFVADPYGSYSSALLRECFDVVNPFKKHYVVDLSCPVEEIGSRGHRKQARKALQDVSVEVCREPAGFVDQWSQLYRTLKIRYNIQGLRAFSRDAFTRQLSMPDVVVLQAFYENEMIGAQIYYQHDDVVFCHLGAVNDVGYAKGAFYAMDYFSFDYFSGLASKLDLGGGAGLKGSADNGLCRYKQGWSSETRPVYFCGRIMNPKRYATLSRSVGQERSSYFPAYRAGEFA